MKGWKSNFRSLDIRFGLHWSCFNLKGPKASSLQCRARLRKLGFQQYKTLQRSKICKLEKPQTLQEFKKSKICKLEKLKTWQGLKISKISKIFA